MRQGEGYGPAVVVSPGLKISKRKAFKVVFNVPCICTLLCYIFYWHWYFLSSLSFHKYHLHCRNKIFDRWKQTRVSFFRRFSGDAILCSNFFYSLSFLCLVLFAKVRKEKITLISHSKLNLKFCVLPVLHNQQKTHFAQKSSYDLMAFTWHNSFKAFQYTHLKDLKSIHSIAMWLK